VLILPDDTVFDTDDHLLVCDVLLPFVPAKYKELGTLVISDVFVVTVEDTGLASTDITIS
jgi:hypothetical protein